MSIYIPIISIYIYTVLVEKSIRPSFGVTLWYVYFRLPTPDRIGWAKTKGSPLEYAPCPFLLFFHTAKTDPTEANERPWRPAALSAATNPAPHRERATPWTANGRRALLLLLLPPLLLLRVRRPSPPLWLWIRRPSSAPSPPARAVER
jgi:hypothetical protein